MTDSGEVIFKPGITLDEFRRTSFGSHANIEETGPGFRRVEIEPVTIAGYKGVCVCAYFDSTLIIKAFICLSWETRQRLWGPERPAGTALNFYKRWIELETGRKSPVQYLWGTLAATEDHWTLEASIFFGYK